MDDDDLAFDLGLFALDDTGAPKRIYDFGAWATWMATSPMRVVGQELVGGRFFVSTVFLGISFRRLELGKALLWETMCFDADHVPVDGCGERYSTLISAQKGHQRAVKTAEVLIEMEGD